MQAAARWPSFRGHRMRQHWNQHIDIDTYTHNKKRCGKDSVRHQLRKGFLLLLKLQEKFGNGLGSQLV